MITTSFPFDPAPARLERLALEYARDHGLTDGAHPPIARLVVDYLLHECTDYHLHRSRPRHRAACEVIGQRFPWLAEECGRRIAQRVREGQRDGHSGRAGAGPERPIRPR